MEHLSPLSIQFIWHPKDDKTVAPLIKYCKERLSRVPDNSFLHSLDFPIFCFTSADGSVPAPINTMAENTLAFAFVSYSIVASKEWTDYLSSVNTTKRAQVIYIALDKTAFKLSFITNRNAIRFNDYIPKYDGIKLERRMFVELAHEIYRWLLNSTDNGRLRLFISHAKNDKKGVRLAEKLNAFIRLDTKMSDFFDVNNIQNGDVFNDTIINGIKESTLIIIHSNSYSTRFWCQKEVICAKENDRPIIEVDCIDGIEDRSFPLMCNYPSIRSTKALEILEFALMETVRFHYCDKLMRMYKTNGYFTKAKTFNRVPDPFMLNDVTEPEIIYPEPELYPEEYEKLTDKPMYTPLSINKANIAERKFGIAISDSPDADMARLGQDRSHLKCLSKTIAQKIIRNGAVLMYGGDFRKDGFTQFIFEEAGIAKSHIKKDNQIMIRNYMSWPAQQGNNLELSIWEAEHQGICEFIKCELPSDIKYSAGSEISGYIWARCLSDMRERMVKESDVRICAGGKVTDFRGCMPGILEELLFAVEQKKPIFLLGGFGGISERICQYLLYGSLPQELTVEWQSSKSSEYANIVNEYAAHGKSINYIPTTGLSIDSLNNGLSKEDNQRLFNTPFLDEVITLISKGLRVIYPMEGAQ